MDSAPIVAVMPPLLPYPFDFLGGHSAKTPAKRVVNRFPSDAVDPGDLSDIEALSVTSDLS